MRISHDKYGLGTITSEKLGSAGKPIAVVVFDSAADTERLILSEFLKPTDAKLPASAKKSRKKKKVAPSPEKIPGALLVETHDPYLPKLSDSPDAAE